MVASVTARSSAALEYRRDSPATSTGGPNRTVTFAGWKPLDPAGWTLSVPMTAQGSRVAPVASAMRIFNLSELNEIDVVYAHAGLASAVEREIRLVLTERHGGEEDFTVTTQAAMLSVFDNVMNVIYSRDLSLTKPAS